MMHRICMIGNSHLASVRTAWPQIKHRFPRFDLVFFGGPGKTIGEVKLSDGHLMARTPRAVKLLNKVSGRDEIKISDYTTFCVVGSGLRPATAAELARQFSTRPRAGRRLLSLEAFIAAVEGSLDRSVAMGLARMIRSATEAPLTLIPQPWPMSGLLSEMDDERCGPAAQLWSEVLDDAPLVSAGFGQAMQQLSGIVDGTVIPQPLSTVERQILTADRFRYFQGTDRKDYAHANADYGTATLEALFATLH